MSFLSRLAFVFWYLRRPPWDSGQTPPELLAFLQNRPAGRVLDLGCGTGTNLIYLAGLGWQAAGVDFVPVAIARARRKAHRAGVSVDFRVGDVTRLEGLSGPFDLALDLGCFHGLGAAERMAYLTQLERLLAPGGTWFLYAFLRLPETPATLGLSAAELEQIATRFVLRSRQDGFDRGARPSAYFVFEKF
jgi:SAM-dependent methyltransferase